MINGGYFGQSHACFLECFHDGRIHHFHQRKEIQPDFVPHVFILQVGTIRNIILADGIQITDDAFSAFLQQRTYHTAILVCNTFQSIYSSTSYQVEQKSLYTIIPMMGHRYDRCVPFFSQLLEPFISERTGCHLDGQVMFFGISFCLKVNHMKRYGKLLT